MSLAFLFAWLPSVIVNAYSLKHADKLKDLQWQFDPLVSKGCLQNKYAYWRILENSSRNFSFPGHEPDRITGKLTHLFEVSILGRKKHPLKNH